MKYFLIERFRIDSWGSPFRLVGSGVDDNADPENERRLQLATASYLKRFKGKSTVIGRGARDRYYQSSC